MENLNEQTTTFKLEDGSKVTIDNNLWIATKSADSYYRSKISNKYLENMHDTRGVLNAFQSEEEARKVLLNWAIDDLGLTYCDDEFIDDNYDEKPKWYEGEGYYRYDELFEDHLSGRYSDDLITYAITPLVDEMAEMEGQECMGHLIEAVQFCGYTKGIEIED